MERATGNRVMLRCRAVIGGHGLFARVQHEARLVQYGMGCGQIPIMGMGFCHSGIGPALRDTGQPQSQ